MQPDEIYSPEPQLYCFQSFDEYTAVFGAEFPPDELTWDQLLSLFYDIEIVGEDGETFPARFDGNAANMDQLKVSIM